MLLSGRPAFLIVMNHSPKHSRRKDPHSASHVQAQNICAVLDCFFSDSDGMYDCVENTDVVKKVANKLVRMTSFTQHDDSLWVSFSSLIKMVSLIVLMNHYVWCEGILDINKTNCNKVDIQEYLQQYQIIMHIITTISNHNAHYNNNIT